LGTYHSFCIKFPMEQFFGYFALKKKFVSTALKNGVGAIS
jgi:hypothetical protein